MCNQTSCVCACVWDGQQEVAAGTPLVVMEAMKMEHVLEAPFAGKVSELFTAVDDFVADSDVVVRLE